MDIEIAYINRVKWGEHMGNNKFKKKKLPGKYNDVTSIGIILMIFGVVTMCAFILPIKAWIMLLGAVLIVCGILLLIS